MVKNIIILISFKCFFINVCTRQPLPLLSPDSMKDAVVLVGQDAEFICKVENLGRHKVAFVRASTPPRLISFDEKIFRQSNKYELRPRSGPKADEWILLIKNSQEEDSGNYTCQVNTDPVIAQSAQLDLRIPPSVSRNTPSAVEVREGHNVTLSCKAEGTPEPSVIWRRQDRQIIRFNGATGYGATIHRGTHLQLTKVSRKHMSEYVCVASNGIPPDESWTVKLLVTFPPIVLPKQEIVRASLNSLARLVCDAESWPRPEVSWEKDGKAIFDSDQYSTSQSVSGQYHSVHILEIRHVEKHHYGGYRCVAKNDNGIHHADLELEESEPSYLYTNSVHPEGSGGNEDDEDADEERRVNHVNRHVRPEEESVRAVHSERDPIKETPSTHSTQLEELRQDTANTQTCTVNGFTMGILILSFHRFLF